MASDPDSRSLRKALEETQARLKTALDLVADLEQRHQQALRDEVSLRDRLAAHEHDKEGADERLHGLQAALAELQRRLGLLDETTPRSSSDAQSSRCQKCSSDRIAFTPLHVTCGEGRNALRLGNNVLALARACGRCGFTELYGDNPQELLTS